MMQVRDLSFSYAERHVFTQWSGQFAPGLVWLQGPNGCGKSTLLKLLGGALAPGAGDVGIDGVSLQQTPLAYRRLVFWLGPGEIAFDHLTAAEYWGFMQHLYPHFDADAAQRHCAGFGLQPHTRLALHKLSTGTQRKVWLVAALAAGTAVTLLDEPMNALDAASQSYLQTALMAQAQDTQRVWITSSHEDLGDAGQLARRLPLA